MPWSPRCTAHDPGAPVLPYLLSGGTDNKALVELGITGYGFAPLQLRPSLDFPAMFHGVDERVPLDALAFGRRVLGTSPQLLTRSLTGIVPRGSSSRRSSSASSKG